MKEVFSRIGTAEVATDPMNPNVADTYVMLQPRDSWRKVNGKTISKEALEDEFITELRMQSYKFAFTLGVIYTLVLPFVDYLGDAVFSPEHAMFKDVGDFQVLWLLLGMQIFYFEYLKRLYK